MLLSNAKYIFKMNSTEVLPENLIVLRIPKSNKSSIITLPKAAILSNEIETDYWVMLLKMTQRLLKFQFK
jgi:hypothetical protein